MIHLSESRTSKSTPVLDIAPRNDIPSLQAQQPEIELDEDDTPAASKLTSQLQKLKKQVRKRTISYDDDALGTQSLPQPDAVLPKLKRPRKQKTTERDKGIDEDGGGDDGPPPKKRPLRSSTPVRPISPVPNLGHPTKQAIESEVPSKKRTKGKAKDEIEHLAVTDDKVDEDIAS